MDNKKKDPLGSDFDDPGFEDVTEQIPQVEKETGFRNQAYADESLGATEPIASSEGLGATESIPASEPSPDDTDVFVILSEGEGADIPVVETEAVEDGESLEGAPLRSSNPLEFSSHEESFTDDPSILKPTAAIGANLDAPEVSLPEEFEEPLFSSATIGRDLPDDPGAFGFSADDEILNAQVGGSGKKRGSLFSVAIGVAAAALVGVGYWGFESGWFSWLSGGAETRVAVAAGAGGASTQPAGGEQPGGVPVGVDPTAGGPGAGETSDQAALKLVRDTFRHKVQLALQLGLTGSDGEESK